MDLREMQREAYQNKVDHHFNITDVKYEFCLLYGEVAEAFDAWNKGAGGVGEELADVAIYLMGLAEILGVDLEDEVVRKMAINRRRVYAKVNGVVQKAHTGNRAVPAAVVRRGAGGGDDDRGRQSAQRPGTGLRLPGHRPQGRGAGIPGPNPHR